MYLIKEILNKNISELPITPNSYPNYYSLIIQIKSSPKNVIDFLQKELNLTTKESIEICKTIYEKQESEQNSDSSIKKEKKVKRIGVKI